ncbi:MAG: YdcF family protein [Oscillospiraceae bacterium]|nr:YdcF family protein [Oscillospiraceae bacterium]
MKHSLIIRIIISITAAALLLWVNCNYFTAGTVIGSVLFGGAFAVCVLWKPFCGIVKRLWSKLGGRIALLIVGAVGAVCAVCCSVFTVNMIVFAERGISDPDAVIVLGCQVRGEEPSMMLARRLDAAIETLSEYPGAVCVVSGGKGSGEDISEAEAMRRYLVERGISADRVITEDRSTDTRENIRFSAELLQERGIDRAVIVTNEFHQYRADIYARRNGLTVGHHSGKTPLYNLLNYTVREWAALFDAFVRR